MKMKAAILVEQNKPLVIEELEIPELLPGQVLVKIMASGICHSQLNEIKGIKGPDKYLPHTLGHEGAGIVEKIGKDVTKVKPGDIVVITWIKGSGNDVPGAQYKRNDGSIVNSGAVSTFSDYSVISENRIVPVSSKMPFKEASLLGCAIPTGAGIIKNMAKLQKDQSVVILGMGGIGSSALMYAASLGCKMIIAVDIVESKLSFAKQMGATYGLNAKGGDIVAEIKKLTNGKGVDVAVECSGSRDAMEMAFNSLHNKGLAIIAGNLKHDAKISINPFDLIVGKRMVGSWGGDTNPDSDIPFYVEKYLSGELPLGKLITSEFRLENINEALTQLEKGQVVRALINY